MQGGAKNSTKPFRPGMADSGQHPPMHGEVSEQDQREEGEGDGQDRLHGRSIAALLAPRAAERSAASRRCSRSHATRSPNWWEMASNSCARRCHGCPAGRGHAAGPRRSHVRCAAGGRCGHQARGTAARGNSSSSDFVRRVQPKAPGGSSRRARGRGSASSGGRWARTWSESSTCCGPLVAGLRGVGSGGGMSDGEGRSVATDWLLAQSGWAPYKCPGRRGISAATACGVGHGRDAGVKSAHPARPAPALAHPPPVFIAARFPRVRRPSIAGPRPSSKRCPTSRRPCLAGGRRLGQDTRHHPQDRAAAAGRPRAGASRRSPSPTRLPPRCASGPRR